MRSSSASDSSSANATSVALPRSMSHPGDRGWMATAKVLSTKVHHHLREEEKKFFQVSGRILGAADKARLAKRYRKDYQRMHKLLREA